MMIEMTVLDKRRDLATVMLREMPSQRRCIPEKPDDRDDKGHPRKTFDHVEEIDDSEIVVSVIMPGMFAVSRDELYPRA